MRNFSVKSLAALECTHYKQLNGLFSSVFNMIVVKEGGGGRDNSTDNKKKPRKKRTTWKTKYLSAGQQSIKEEFNNYKLHLRKK